MAPIEAHPYLAARVLAASVHCPSRKFLGSRIRPPTLRSGVSRCGDACRRTIVRYLRLEGAHRSCVRALGCQGGGQ